MNYAKLAILRDKPFFRAEDVARILGIRPVSARVLCSRYVQNGLFTRLKRDYYILTEKWKVLAREEFLQIANFIQVPSYISFTTALAFYNLTTQVQRDFWESAAWKRSCRFQVEGTEFHYFKLQKRLYFGFQRTNGIFMAIREKALLDSLYLYSLGRYPLDLPALDLGKLDRRQVKGWMRQYPKRTQKLVKELCKI